jgi:signal recognition particle subunit SRP19
VVAAWQGIIGEAKDTIPVPFVQEKNLTNRWNSLYPIYFDAKQSIAKGRRVPREYALWYPQAQHISIACRNLGLQSCLEVSHFKQSVQFRANADFLQPNRTHPADFENPGRVKVLFKQDGKYLNPIIKNRESVSLIVNILNDSPKTCD